MKKILIVLAVLVLLGVGLYLWLSPLNNDVNVGLQKLNEPPLVLQTSAVPTDWQSFKQNDWAVSYPAIFEVKELPGISGSQSFLFIGKTDKSLSVDITIKSFDSLPEKDLIQKMQKVASYKNESISIADAILLVQQEGNNSLPENDRPQIVIERRISSNGISGVQFATRNPKDNSINLKTSFEKNGEIVDIAISPRLLDGSDALMKIYVQMLSSFYFINS